MSHSILSHRVVWILELYDCWKHSLHWARKKFLLVWLFQMQKISSHVNHAVGVSHTTATMTIPLLSNDTRMKHRGPEFYKSLLSSQNSCFSGFVLSLARQCRFVTTLTWMHRLLHTALLQENGLRMMFGPVGFWCAGLAYGTKSRHAVPVCWFLFELIVSEGQTVSSYFISIHSTPPTEQPP